MEATKLNTIAENNVTAIEIFDVLSKRQRVRKILDLRRFEYDLVQEGRKVDHDELMKTFKMLQDAGAGAIVRKKDQPLRFVWNKNLKTVASEALSNVNLSSKKYVNPVKGVQFTEAAQTKLTPPKPRRKPGRPPGAKNKSKPEGVQLGKENETMVAEMNQQVINEALIQKIADRVMTEFSKRFNNRKVA